MSTFASIAELEVFSNKSSESEERIVRSKRMYADNLSPVKQG